MNTPDPKPHARASGLVRQVCAQLDVPSVGLGFAAAAAVVIALFVFGLSPTALGLGLVALLVVD